MPWNVVRALPFEHYTARLKSSPTEVITCFFLLGPPFTVQHAADATPQIRTGTTQKYCDVGYRPVSPAVDTFLRSYTVQRAAGATPQTRTGTSQKRSSVEFRRLSSMDFHVPYSMSQTFYRLNANRLKLKIISYLYYVLPPPPLHKTIFGILCHQTCCGRYPPKH